MTSLTPLSTSFFNPFFIDMDPYLIASETGISIFFLTLLKSFLDNTIKGEPSFHHIFL